MALPATDTAANAACAHNYEHGCLRNAQALLLMVIEPYRLAFLAGMWRRKASATRAQDSNSPMVIKSVALRHEADECDGDIEVLRCASSGCAP